MNLSVYELQTAVSGAGIIALSAAAWFKGRNNRMNIATALFFLSVALWQIDLLLLKKAESEEFATMVSRILRPAIIFLPVLFFRFVRLLSKEKNVYKKMETVFFFAAAFLSVLNVAGIGFGGVVFKERIGYIAKPDAIYAGFLLILLACTGTGFFLLIKKLVSPDSRSFEKLQIKYIGLGAFTGLLGGMTNVLNMFGYDVYPMGGFSALVFFVIISYMVFSYNLMNIREMAQKSAMYLAVASLIVIVFAFSEYVLLAGIKDQIFRVAFYLALAAAVASGVEPALRYLDKLTKKAFFISDYDFQVMLQHVLSRLRAHKNAENAVTEASENIAKALKLKSAPVYFLDEESKEYRLYNPVLFEKCGLKPGHPLIKNSLAAAGSVVFYKSIYEGLTYRFDKENKNSEIFEAVAVLEKHNAVLFIPIIINSGCAGVLIASEKENKTQLTWEEITWLKNVTAQLSVTLENIALYNRLVKNERLAMIGKMSSAVAHEIRNPLAGLSGFVQMMEKGSPSRKEAMDKFMEIAPEEFKRLERLTDNLLALSHSSSFVFEILQPNSVLKECAELLKYSFSKNRVKMEIKGNESRIKADKRQLKQIIVNVLNNALQASPAGAAVEAGVSSAEVKGKRYAVIYVSDCGAGMTKEVQERIFEPFFTTKAGGTGLGLSICKSITEAMGGFVTAENGTDCGAVFKIYLPEEGEK